MHLIFCFSKLVDLIISPSRYFYPGAVYTVSEPDGIRIFSSYTCDILEKVPGTSSLVETYTEINVLF